MANEGMKDLIQLINKLQDAASMAGMNLGQLDLPQIAVIGEQSTGKSSVLENFVGRDFLPRGHGIVTRRPLVLQLHYIESEEYAEFLHLPEKKFTNFLEVRKEIEAETDRSTNGSKGISKTPINLRIYSPNVLELTLVDLPGITQVPVGDQPPDIAKQILDMILEYISQDNTLILAVSPASQDLANSNALKLAKSVDPEGTRTIGVLTKLDLMDRGTDARDILENKMLPLRRGYVGLVNRSQEDIVKGKDITLAQEAEAKFFKNHDAYKHMADRMGTKHLQQVLNEQLCEHIRDRMPVIRTNMKQQHHEVTSELENLHAFEEVQSDTWKQTHIFKLIHEFSEDFKTSIEGHSIKSDGNQLNTGAQINHCIYDEIHQLLNQLTPPNEMELKIWMQNEHGYRNPLFTGSLTFDIVIRDMLHLYSEPVKNCVELISDILSSAIVEQSKKLMNYPRLKESVQLLLMEKIKVFARRTTKHLLIHLDAQGAFMNTKHPEFKRIIEISALRDTVASNPNESEQLEGRNNKNKKKQAINALEAIEKGWICLVTPGQENDSKWYWFILNNDGIKWFTTDDETEEPVNTVQLDGLRLVSNSNNGKHVLGKNGNPLCPEFKTLSLTFRNIAEQESWLEAFRTAGVEVTSNKKDDEDPFTEVSEKESCALAVGTKDGGSRRRLYEKVASDPEIQDGCDMLVYMVKSYMKIVDRTVHDLVPKYIMLLLVKEIIEYASKRLLGDIMASDLWKDLLEVSPREVLRRERLMALYKSTKEAMEIMSSVDVL